MLRSLLLLASLSFALPALCQTAPTWQWAKALTSAGNTAIYDLATDAQGNTYVAGGFTGQLPFSPTVTLTSEARYDGFVAKYDAQGNLLWAQPVSGPAEENVTGIALDAAANVYLVGGFTTAIHTGNIALTGGTQLRSFIGKLNAQGQPQWLRQDGYGSGSSGGGSASGVAVDAAGGLYLTGRVGGTCLFGNVQVVVPTPGNDIFLAKYDAQGNVQWVSQGGRVNIGTGVTSIFSHRITVSSGGEAYLSWGANAGAEGFGALPIPASLGGSDLVVVKFSATGVPQWLQRAGGPGADRASGMTLDGQGHLLVAGSFVGQATYGSTTLTGTGSESGVLAQFDAGSGAVTWARQLSSTTAARYMDVTADAQGNAYAVGTFIGSAQIEQQTLNNAGGRDAVVSSYSPQGALRWAQHSGGAGDEDGQLIRIGGAGRLMVGGALSGSGLFGSNPITGQGNFSSFVAQLSTAPTASRAVVEAAPLTLFPNPAHQRVWLRRPSGLMAAAATLTVRNSLGQLVHNQVLDLSNQTLLELTGLAPGVYHVQVQSSTRLYRQRLVVE